MPPRIRSHAGRNRRIANFAGLDYGETTIARPGSMRGTFTAEPARPETQDCE